MHEAEVTHAASSKGLHAIELALERMRAFDSEESPDHPITTTGFDLASAPYQSEFVRAAFGGLQYKVDLLVHDIREPAHSLRDRQGNQSKELCSHAGVAQAGQVDVTCERCPP